MMGPTDADLRAAGWQRCFVADEPRLSEALETYREIGFEVIVVPIRADDGECNECMRACPEAFRVIYVRKAVSQGHEPDAPCGLEPCEALSRKP